MLELLFSCVVAVSSSTSMYLSKPISRAKDIVLNKAIDIESSPTKLKEFLDIPLNYSISRQFHYETALIKFLLNLTSIISLIVIISSLVILFSSTDISSESGNYGYAKYIVAAAVFNILFTLGCHFLARNVDDKLD